jgi:hypothetical protein
VDAIAALAITDTNYAYDMHAYTGSLTEVTTWAKTNKKRLFLSEVGVAITSATGQAAVSAYLTHMNANRDVWVGWTTWNLPPYNLWTGNYTTPNAAFDWYGAFLTPGMLK